MSGRHYDCPSLGRSPGVADDEGRAYCIDCHSFFVPKDQVPPELRRPWRVGRSLGRTLYIALGDEASKDDIVFGMVDTKTLAEHIVALHNEWLADRPDGRRTT